MLGSCLDLGDPVSDDPINDGLVEFWLPLEHNSGGNTLFGLKNGLDGTLTNSPGWVAGPNGFGALSFDGTSRYVQLPSLAGAATTRATFAALLRLPAHSPGLQRGAWFWNTCNFDSHYVWSDGNIYDGTFRASRQTVGAGVVSDRSQWHVVTVTTKPGASGWNFYQNGKLANSTTGDASFTLSSAPKIGFSQSTYYFVGDIQAVAIWDRDKSAPDVFALYEDWLAGYHRSLRWWSRSVSAPAAGGGTGATVSPSPASSSWSAPSPSVSAGATLTPAAVASLWEAPATTPSGGATAAPDPAASDWAAAAPAVTTGATVTPDPAASTWSVVAPTLTTGVTLTPSPVSSDWAVPDPASVGVGAAVTPGPAASDWAAVSATVTGGATAAPGAVASDWAVAAVTVTADSGVTVAPASAGSDWAVAGAAATGSASVTVSPAASDWTTPAHAASVGADVAPSPVASGWSAVAATVTTGVSLAPSAVASDWGVVTVSVSAGLGAPRDITAITLYRLNTDEITLSRDYAAAITLYRLWNDEVTLS